MKQEISLSDEQKQCLLLGMAMSLPKKAIPKFSAFQHFPNTFLSISYLQELGVSRFLHLSACLKPQKLENFPPFTEIKSE